MSLPRSLRSLHSGLLKSYSDAHRMHGYSQAADARAWKREKGGHKLLGLRYNKTYMYVVKSCERTHIWAWTYSLGRLGPKESV